MAGEQQIIENGHTHQSSGRTSKGCVKKSMEGRSDSRPRKIYSEGLQNQSSRPWIMEKNNKRNVAMAC